MRIRAWVAAPLIAMITACSSPDAPAAPADRGPQRLAAGGGPLVVEAGPLVATLVLDAVPAGFRVVEAAYNQPPLPYGPIRSTLYGDPNLGGAPRGLPGERRVELGDRSGWLVHVDDRTYVGFDIEGQDYAEFVVARGLDDEQVLAAAGTASFGDLSELDPAAVPAGLEPLLQAGPSDGPLNYRSVGLHLTLRAATGTIQVSAVRADPRLAALWGFWTDDAVGTVIRGGAGSDGILHGTVLYDDQRAVVWAEDGNVVAVSGYAVTAADLDAIVAGLRPGTEAEMAALQAAVLDVPPAEELGCPGAIVVTAVEGDLRWIVGIGESEGGRWQLCNDVIVSGSGSLGGGSGTFALPRLGRLSATAFGIDGPPPTIGGTTVGGVAPPGTTRAVVRGPDGIDRDCVLADSGPRPGERVLGCWVPGPLSTEVRQFTVMAYGSAGQELDVFVA